MAPLNRGRPATGVTPLQRALDDAGMSQADLARMTGLRVQGVSDICKGGVVPHPGVMLKIARALKRPVIDLFDFTVYERAFDELQERQRAARRPKKK